MANNRREVDLIVKTQDETSRVFNLINKVLDVFSENADEVGAKAEKAGSGVTGLGKAFGDLNRALRGQTAITTATANLDKATAAMGRLDDRSKKLGQGLNEIKQKFGEAGVQATQLAQRQGQLDQRLKTQNETLEKTKTTLTSSKEALSAVTEAQRKFDGAVTTSTGKVATIQKNIEKTIAVYEKQAAAIDAADKPFQRQISSLAKTQERLEKYYKALQDTNAALAQQKQNAEIAAQVTAAYTEQVATVEKTFQAERAEIVKTNDALKQNGRETAANAKLQAELAENVNLQTQAVERNAQEQARSAEQLEKVKATYQEIGAATERLAVQTKGQLVDALRIQQSTVDQLRNRHDLLREALAKVAAELDRTGVPTKEVAEAFNTLKGALTDTKAAVTEQATVYKRLRETVANLPPDLKESEKAVEQFIREINAGADALNRIDKEVKEASASFSRFDDAQRRVAPATREVTTALKEESLGLKAIFDGTQRLGSAKGSVEGLAGAYRSLYGETRQALSYTQRLRSEVLALISTYGGFFAIVNVLTSTVEATQKIEAAQVRLKSVFGSNAAAAKEFDFIRREANRLGVDIGVLADEYSKFSAATQNTNIQGAETRRIFLAVAEAGRVQHLSLEDMSGIFKALQQIVSKGHVQLEELSGQLGDRLPGALQIMADGLGITVAELLKLTKAGALSSDALSAFADNLEKRYGKDLPDALKTTSTEVGRFWNSVTQALLAFGQGGFIEGFNTLLQSMSTTFTDPKFLEFIQEISSLLGVMAKALGLVIDNWELLTAALLAFVGVRLIGVITSIVGAIADLTIGATAATRAIQGMTLAEREFATARAATTLEGIAGSATTAAGALGRVTSALRFLLSGVGVVLVGFGFLVKGFYDIVTTAPDATAALAESGKVLDQVGVALDGAGQNIEKYRESLRGLSADTVKASIDQLEAVKSFQQVDLIQRLEQVIEAAKDPRTMASPTDARAAQQLVILKLAFDEGKISLDEYVSSLEKVRKENSDANFDVAGFSKSMSIQAEASDQLNKRIQNLKDIYTVLTGKGKDAQDAFERLQGTYNNNDDALKDNTTDADKFTQALAAMDAVLPGLNKNLKIMKDAAKLDEAFDTAKKYVHSVQELLELTDKYNKNKADILYAGANAPDAGYIDKVIAIESRGNPIAKNNDSSAEGIGQFIDKTWLALFRKYYPAEAANMAPDAILELKKDAGISRALLEKFTEENAQQLQKFGVAIDDANLYLAHFLGAGDAIKVLKSAPGTPLQGLISQQSIDANKSVLQGKTNTEVIQWAQQLVGINKQDLDVMKALNAADAKRAKSAQELKESQDRFHAGLKADVKAVDDENKALGQGVIERETAKALAEKQAEATKKGTTLSKAEIADIKRVTAEKYKQAALDEKQKKLDEAVNEALEKRNQLVALRTAKTDAGDTAGAAAITPQIAAANAELLKATDAASAFYKTLSGPKADAAAAKMAAINQQAKNFTATGSDLKVVWTGIGQSLLDNLSTAFDTFAQSVANGENAWKALGTAVRTAAAQILIDIGNMIIKIALFRALSSFFPGLSSGIPGITAHDGTGSGAIGAKSPTRTRSLSPFMVAMAPRFHGGYDGLAPNEVATVLDKSEAVLTKEDPFHPKNRAKMYAGMSDMFKQQLGLTIINTMDPADIVEAGLNTPRGDKVLVNRIGKNKESVKKTVNG